MMLSVSVKNDIRKKICLCQKMGAKQFHFLTTIINYWPPPPTPKKKKKPLKNKILLLTWGLTISHNTKGMGCPRNMREWLPSLWSNTNIFFSLAITTTLMKVFSIPLLGYIILLWKQNGTFVIYCTSNIYIYREREVILIAHKLFYTHSKN